ncbi:DUF1049 domain-containing protein, partial [bacterium]|nr:DUF1049 domain-containing protein [bacterium]
MSRLVKLLCLLVFVAILAWFAAQNNHKVSIHYYENKPLALLGHERGPDGSRIARPMPVYLLVLGCVFVGGLIGGLLLIGPQLKVIRENQALEQKIAEQREELDVLRKIPIGQADEDDAGE